MTSAASIAIDKDKVTLIITAAGSWRALNIADVDSVLRQLDLKDVKKCVVNGKGISDLDTTGAWVLVRLYRRLLKRNVAVKVEGLNKTAQSVLNEVHKVEFSQIELEVYEHGPFDLLADFGRECLIGCSRAVRMIGFLGVVIECMINTIKDPSKLRYISVNSHVERTGIRALPIIGLISFLIGIVLVYQGAYQLRRFGAEIFAVDLLAISVLREIGILITAIVVAGRSGSAFTAQIGTMKLNQEVDAMHTFGIDVIEALVLPRVLGLMISLPLVAFYADIMGLIGGAFMAVSFIDLSLEQFITQLNQAVTLEHFWVGLSKAPFFAFIIAVIGCYEGLRVEGGAESVGQRTTMSVVEGIFLVIVANAGFSVFYTYIGV